tara:strand:- start:312 stop:521 length:210 start_codon:yes stop_codon:yes gene_type:complete
MTDTAKKVRREVSETIAWAKYHGEERELENLIERYRCDKDDGLSLEEREAVTQAWTEIQVTKNKKVEKS